LKKKAPPNSLDGGLCRRIRAGNFPEAEKNGTRYLKIPLRLDDALKSAA
jgi:hypothetical protein